MKILTILGNGFDLGHQLPTQFDDFINSKRDVYGKNIEILAMIKIVGEMLNPNTKSICVK